MNCQPTNFQLQGVAMSNTSEFDAQADIDNLKKEDSIKRSLRKDPWPDLRPHLTQIIGWARAKGGSKNKIKILLSLRYKDMQDVSADRIYRFVKANNSGIWPNGRKNKGEK